MSQSPVDILRRSTSFTIILPADIRDGKKHSPLRGGIHRTLVARCTWIGSPGAREGRRLYCWLGWCRTCLSLSLDSAATQQLWAPVARTWTKRYLSCIWRVYIRTQFQSQVSLLAFFLTQIDQLRFVMSKLTENVNEYVHLGHIIISDFDDICDVTHRRNCCVSQMNCVLCFFNKLDFIVKLKSFKLLRRILGLPYNAHS
jgi:hypothetical protein